MDLNKWFQQGITEEAYIESLDKHKESFLHIQKNVALPEDRSFYDLVKQKHLRIIILAEPWCGHCMLNIPILLRLAKETNTPVRFLPRDENLELMDQYLTNDKRIIPIFIFIDEAGNEVAKWGPTAPETKAFADKHKADLPPKDSEDYKEAFRTFATFTSKEFKENSDFWYYTFNSLKNSLIKALN